MLFLLCEVDGDRYALDVRRIAEVLPLVAVQPVAQAPRGVAGLINYRGKAVPVVDLSMMLAGRPSFSHLTSRIVVLDVSVGGTAHLLGLLAEHAVQTARYDESAFVPSGIGHGRAACTEVSGSTGGGVIQWLDVDALLTDALRDALFVEAGRC